MSSGELVKRRKFTEHARRAGRIAYNAAAAAGDKEVSTTHLLFGLAQVADSRAAVILKRFNVSLESITAYVTHDSANAEPGSTLQVLRVTVGYEQPVGVTFRYAFEEARRMSDALIGTEHLLVAIIRQNGEGARALHRLGVPEADAVRLELVRLRDELDGGRMHYPNALENEGRVYEWILDWSSMTDAAQRVMRKAYNCAANTQSESIGTDHILYGLANAGGTTYGGQPFYFGRYTASLARQSVLSLRGNYGVRARPSKLTPGASRVIEYARKLVAEAGRSQIDAPHLALAILESPSGWAHEMIRSAGVNLESTKEGLKSLISTELKPDNGQSEPENKRDPTETMTFTPKRRVVRRPLAKEQ